MKSMNVYLYVFFVFSLSGCTYLEKTMYSHYNLNDGQTEGFATWAATIDMCVYEKHLAPNEKTIAQSVANEYLSYTVYDRKVFENTYQSLMDSFNSMSDSSLYYECQSLHEGLPGTIETLAQRTVEVRKLRQIDSNSFSNSLNTSNSYSSAISNSSYANLINSLGSSSIRSYGSYGNRSSSSGTPVYDSSECIGAVVNGRCTGSINPSPSNVLRKKCYGTMINGECQGAVGY